MKKRIKKREYNTETAELLAVSVNNNEENTLYRKTSGEFFLHSLSGELENIFPLSYAEAREWADEHLLEEEKYMIFHGNKEKGNVNKTFSISKIAAEKLKNKAAKENVSMSEVLNRLILENIF